MLTDLSAQIVIGALMEEHPAGHIYAGRSSDGGDVAVLKFGALPGGDHLLGDLAAWISYAHQNLAATVAVGHIGGHRVAVFERRPGRRLLDVVAGAPVQPELALKYVQDVALAMEGAHEIGLASGDISSKNVTVEGDVATLHHLGMARISCALAGHRLPFGNPTYLAPEVPQLNQGHPTPSSDVYALGILLYEVLSGRAPFTGTVEEVLHQHLESPLPAPSMEGGLSLAIAGILLRMTAKQPSARLQTAGAVAKALSALREGLTGRSNWMSTSSTDEGSGDWWGSTVKKVDHGDTQDDWTLDLIPRAPAATAEGPSSSEAMKKAKATGWGAGASARLPREFFQELLVDPEATPPTAPQAAAPQPKQILPAAPPPPPQGKSLTLGKKVAQGPVGFTYEASYAGAPAMVKVVSRRIEGGMLERLKQGCVAAKTLDHANIVQLHRIANVQGRLMLVYEPASGQVLAERLRDGPLPSDLAVTVVEGVAKALAHAGAKGVHHGDLRPQKVFVTAEGKVQLADFGLAESAASGGIPFGHPAYLAPEVLQERLTVPTARTDVYALGILLYELVTGRPPFTGASPREILTQHLSASLPPPPPGVHVPPPVAEAVLRMTAKNPSRRPTSASDVLLVLEQCPKKVDIANILESVDVEEFDPTATLNSPEEWNQVMAGASVAKEDGWSRKQIEEIRDSSKERTYAPAPTRKGLGPPKPKTSFKPIAVAMLVLVLGPILAIALMSSDDDDANGTPRDPPVDVVVDPPNGDKPPPVDVPPKPDPEVATTLEDLNDLIASDDLLNATKLVAMLDGATIVDPKAQQRFNTLRIKLNESIGKRVDRDRELVEGLLKLGEVSRAAIVTTEMQAWAQAHPNYQALELKVRRRVSAREKVLERLKLPKAIDMKTTERQLSHRLRGWKEVNGKLYAGGAVSLEYPTRSRALVDDLDSVRGRSFSVQNEPSLGVEVVTVKGSVGKPAILLHELPLMQPVSISVEFALAHSNRPGSRLAIVCGATRQKPAGRGTDWGLATVELKDDRLREMNSMPVPKLRARSPMRMVLTTSQSSRPSYTDVSCALIDYSKQVRHEGRKFRIRTEDLRGHIAIFVEGTEVQIRAMELRGLLDPEGLGSRRP